MARKRLGQHFLADLDWREQIARAIRVSPHSTVPLPEGDTHCWIEIGAGHGEMTEPLAATGAPVYAIEIDPLLGAGLQRLTKQFSNLDIISSDVLKTDLISVAKGRRMRIYGNLPYYITSPILHHLFHFADAIDEIHVVVQTEVAERLAAQPCSRDYGYLSIITQFYARPEFVFEIPRDAFDPPPEVTSALVTLRLPGARANVVLPRESPPLSKKKARGSSSAEEAFLDFVKVCFSQKRKTLVNNLRSIVKPAAGLEMLEAAGLRPDARAEQLTVSQFATLYASLCPK